MKHLTTLLSIVVILFAGFLVAKKYHKLPGTGAPPYEIEDLQPPTDPYEWIRNWTRPDGPARVGLQVGHWKNDELPDELSRLRGNTGATGGGKSESEVNFTIAEKTKEILEKQNIIVDILPSTVPPKYWADVFVAIHADGSLDRSASGFKVAAPRRDFSGKSDKLVDLIENSYQDSTKLSIDPNVTNNMRGYYSFAWWRYEHAVHPRATSVILETGFLSNANDRKIIVHKPELSAQGLAEAITIYLTSEGIL
jgi:hypothetical protein